MQVKAHAHAQAEAEQVEAGAHGKQAQWESGGRQVCTGDSRQRHRWASGMNPNNREISVSTKKKRGQTHAPNYIPATKFVLGLFGPTLGKRSEARQMRQGGGGCTWASRGGCRQVVRCIQQVEASWHEQESRGRQVHMGDSRQKHR